jgi:hypothetical protein
MPTYIVNSHNPSDCRKKTTLQQIAIEDAETDKRVAENYGHNPNYED